MDIKDAKKHITPVIFIIFAILFLIALERMEVKSGLFSFEYVFSLVFMGINEEKIPKVIDAKRWEI